jgi:hypothetical protein
MTMKWMTLGSDCDGCDTGDFRSPYDEDWWRNRFKKPARAHVRIELIEGDLLDPITVTKEPADNSPEPKPIVIHIGPLAFLRSMFTLAWTAFRHPFSTTVIDLSTGRAVCERSSAMRA